MSIIVYKPGDTALIRGTYCDFVKIEAEELDAHLENGWHLDPKAAYEAIVHDVEGFEFVEIEEAENGGGSSKPYDAMTNAEIRQAAKKAGHKKWETARIDPLKEFLKNG